MMTSADVLTPEEVAAFEQRGFVQVPAAFARADALAMQEFMWEQLRAGSGIERDNPSTWSYAHGLNRTAEDPIYEAIAAPRLCGAMDQLLGAGMWDAPKSWGGFLVTFPRGTPDTWDLTSKDWHWDGNPDDHLRGLGGLFVFTLFSDIRPRGGGTLIASGSHRLIHRFFERLPPEVSRQKQKPLKQRFSASHPWLAELTGAVPHSTNRVQRFMQNTTEIDGVLVNVVEITGEPGDAFLCHPSIFHAASPNHADAPRFMRVKGLSCRR
jgi:hypothetical protein